MCRCVCAGCVCHISLMLLLPTASTILLSFCCILLSSLLCCCCCCFICCLPLERLLLISGWLGLSSAQLCSVQFSSAQPFSPLLSSYFLFIFCRVFFARFHFYLPLSRCMCVCVLRLASDWTHHTRARTPAFTCDTHTHRHTHTETSTWPFRRLHPPHCKIRSLYIYIVYMYGT